MNFKLLNKIDFFRKWLLPLLFCASCLEAVPNNSQEKPLVVLITSYNNQDVVKKNLQSVFMQRYSNYRVIYIDDCSTDNTEAVAKAASRSFLQKNHVTFIRNKERKGALANIYYAVHSCKDDEIIVSLDGDDWFAHKEVLKRINEAYASPDVWLTHGSLIEYPNRSSSWCIPIQKEIVSSNGFRTYRCPSHLRTFYAWLFKKIYIEDLVYEGSFFPMTWDQAMMFPMVEMAGERHLYISEILYVYNVANAINDNKVNPQLQNDLEAYIRSMPPYHRLDKSPLE